MPGISGGCSLSAVSDLAQRRVGALRPWAWGPDSVELLGPLLSKIHIKDFKLNPNGHGGQFVHPRDGSVNWPVVRQALEEAGWNVSAAARADTPEPQFGQIDKVLKRVDQVRDLQVTEQDVAGFGQLEL